MKLNSLLKESTGVTFVVVFYYSENARDFDDALDLIEDGMGIKFDHRPTDKEIKRAYWQLLWEDETGNFYDEVQDLVPMDLENLHDDKLDVQNDDHDAKKKELIELFEGYWKSVEYRVLNLNMIEPFRNDDVPEFVK